jgi:error-prone DNA polymerase
VLPIDINFSEWDHIIETNPKPSESDLPTHEGQPAGEGPLRLGFRLIKGLREEDAVVLLAGRRKPFTSINDLRDAGLSDAALERLADADAFRSIGLDRRQALWEVSTKDRSEALFAGQLPPDAVNETVILPTLLPSEQVVQDYATTALSLKAHPVSFVRPQLEQLGVTATKDLTSLHNGQPVKVAGLVLVRQRPGTAKGVWFMTIEDETGFANLVIFPQVGEQYRKAMHGARLFLAEGTVQVEGEVIHVIVKTGYDLSKLLRRLTSNDTEDLPLLTLSRADEKVSPTDTRVARQEKLFPDARNFR